MHTIEQKRLAQILGIEIALDSFDVAAARLTDAVAPQIGLEPAQPASDRQKNFADSLGCDVSRESKRVASAKIGEALLENNRQALLSMNLKPGDRVVRKFRVEYEGEIRMWENEYVVSSIGSSGRVFFKGGNGQGAWPSQIQVVSG